jgi:predicted Zn-dependent peptidase
MAGGPEAVLADRTEVLPGAWMDRIEGGPRILMIPQRTVPMFSCTVLVPAGSALETGATNGAAHYLEHLLFNGTTTRTREEIYGTTDLLGAYNNASTQRERTVFQLLLPSENWRAGLELQADMILHSTLPREMFEKEKGIILEELAKDRTDPGYEAERFTSRVLWGEDPRALPVLGTEESISNMDPAAVAAFYRECYHPEGMTIVLMGDFDISEATAEIGTLYGGRESGASRDLPPRPEFPPGRVALSESVTGLGKVEVRVLLPLPALDPSDRAGARILEELLTSGERSSLTRAIEAAGLSALSVSASIDAGRPVSVLTLAVDLPEGSSGGEIPGTSVPVAGNLLAHLARFAEVGPWPDELESARRSFAAEELSLQEKMHYYGFMRAEVLGSDHPEVALRMVHDLDGDVAGVARRLAREALRDGRIRIALAGPEIGSARETFDSVPGPETASWLPPPEAIEIERLDYATPLDAPRGSGIRRTVLENGLVLIQQTGPESRTFAAHVLFRDRGGLESALGLPPGAVDVVHRLMSLGTETLDENALRGRLAGLGAKLKITDADWIPYDDYYFTPEYSYVRIETFDTFGLAAIDLLGEIVNAPRFEDRPFERAREAAVIRAEKDRGTPSNRAVREFHRALGENHPLAEGVLGSPEALHELSLEDARRLHGALIDPARMVVTVSSNLPFDRVGEAVRLAFPGAGATRVSVPEDWRPAEEERERTVAVETGMEQSWIVVGFPVTVPEPDRPALRLATSILSERLADRLREREGLAYRIGASVRLDGAGPCVRMSAGTRSENLERMREGMLEISRSLTQEPPTPEEIEGARNRGEGRRRLRRLSRIGQAYALAMLEWSGRDPTHPDADLPGLREVTAADIERVADRYFRPERSITAIAR